MLKIGLIADTHNILLDSVMTNLQTCDYIFHAGDITNESLLKSLENIAPVFVVRGNNDRNLHHLPKFLVTRIMNHTIYMTHQYENIPNNTKDYDIVIFGHSHRYTFKETKETIFINPGSCGKKRFSLPLTMCYLYLDKRTIKIEKIDL